MVVNIGNPLETLRDKDGEFPHHGGVNLKQITKQNFGKSAPAGAEADAGLPGPGVDRKFGSIRFRSATL
jgi:hypothetical protein